MWADGTNWVGDAVAPGSGETATFSGAGNGNTTINLGAGTRSLVIVANGAAQVAGQISGDIIGSGLANGTDNALVKFGNGNGLSIIKHAGSYGGKEGLWEVMLLDTEDEPLYGEFEDGDCIIGWLTDEALKSLILDLNTKYQA